MMQGPCRPVCVMALCAGFVWAGMLPDPSSAVTKQPAKPRPAARVPAPPEATPEQLKAAELVYYGHYDCAFDQSVDVTVDIDHRRHT